MHDPDYRQFMLELVQNLEPLSHPAGTILMDELDEVGELTFVHKGKVAVGYELNKVRKLCI